MLIIRLTFPFNYWLVTKHYGNIYSTLIIVQHNRIHCYQQSDLITSINHVEFWMASLNKSFRRFVHNNVRYIVKIHFVHWNCISSETSTTEHG